jgi:hypothetical protein
VALTRVLRDVERLDDMEVGVTKQPACEWAMNEVAARG